MFRHKNQNIMKIMFDHQMFIAQRVGGVSRYHIELKKGLEKIPGVCVDIPVLLSDNVYLLETQKKIERRIYRSNFLKKVCGKINRISSIITIILKEYDIVHPTWYSKVNLYPHKGKLVITIHDMIQEIFESDFDAATRERKKQAIYSADGIIAISENTKKDILRLYPDVPEEKIRVIYHGTNHLPLPQKPNQFDVPQKYILYVGQRGTYKNAKFVMKALADTFEKNSDLHLVFVGGGPFDAAEKALIKELSLENQIMQKTVSDAELAYLYSKAICFVYPSIYEGFGFPILEAFDNNCPVVCSNASCLPEVAGEAALYFNPQKQEELKEKVEEFLSDDGLREKYIAKGAERVKKFTWEKTAQETKAFYDEICEDKYQKL